MTTHRLKTLPEYFQAVYEGKKNFEVRVNDRNFKTGDHLVLLEYDKATGYNGHAIEKRVSYIMEGGNFGLDRNHVVMALESIDKKPLEDPEKETCRIYGSEINFEIRVPLEESREKAQDIWNNPEKYSKYKKGSDDAYYKFLKFLWILKPNVLEVKLTDIVDKYK